MKKGLVAIGVRGTLVISVLALVSTAFFFRGVEPGITFGTFYTKTKDGIDLKIDSHAIYNGVVVPASTWALKNLVPYSDRFFNFPDIKPGDSGENTISIHIEKKSAWVCLEFSRLKSKENSINEPEGWEEPNGFPFGELAKGVEFFAWHDDGDNLFEVGEVPIFGPEPASTALHEEIYAIADKTTGPPIPADTTKYFGLEWCAGDMNVNLGTGVITCDGSALGNEAQTDSFTFDVSIHATASHGRPHFKCGRTGGHYDPPPKGDQCEVEITVTNNNSANVTNTVTTTSSTGGNTGGNVTTGSASSSTTITNIINSNTTDISDLISDIRNRVRRR